jgi:hypothetical protein
MTGAEDARLIADGLKFLAAGFEMAAESGAPASVRRIMPPPAPGERVEGERTKARASCSVESMQVGDFGFRLPFEFLLGSIGLPENACEMSGEEARGAASFGNPQDYCETYRLSRVALRYEGQDEGFRLTAELELGERLPPIYAQPGVGGPRGTYQAVIDVAFRDIFRFLFPTTKAHAEAIRAKLDQTLGLQVAMPSFYVSK